MTTADIPASGADPTPSQGSSKQKGQGVLKTRAGYAWVGLVFAAVLGILVLVFILQNLEQSKVEFFVWTWNLPIGILVLLAVIVGALGTALVGGYRILQLRRAAKKATK
ncbi:lipopolysaccharide assembly protein LapA domain-containing protein [Nocardia yamanashiensis]|uniref:LapA family protein n=1 Tax=Nocardia yamanashiensis TaxID=209247 RepID=UPI0009FC3E1A|nr:lipopolysaccharide assembly protein LapA domain-containing protein [Nocardia yamanashiensis]UGT42156.1 lipopolysaccharide assembly protein LapA domain-containing protein [Nocardia yamanashiensis]